MAMVNTEKLTRYYGSRRALNEVSFSIEAGEVVGVLGLNGAGKSTLLKILAGVLLPTSGEAQIDGRSVVSAESAARSRIGYLPEEPPVYREMSVGDYLRFAAKLKGCSPDRLETRLPQVLEQSGLATSDLGRVIGELSHGYRKRVGIAQAILHGPALVILDEPISGLDPRQIVEMRDTIKALRGEHTVLVSSHILSEISQTCDRILLIHEGRLLASGTEDELAERLGGNGGGFRLELRGEEKQIRSALEKIDGISGLRFLNDAHRHDASETGASTEGAPQAGSVDTVCKRVSLRASEKTIEEAVQALVEARVGVRQVSPTETELEQAFLDLTRSSSKSASEKSS